jgi:hypothetical protein
VNSKRVITKIGDVFSVPLGGDSKKYFQYIANDRTQLNSDVIRAFKKKYSMDEAPNLSEIAGDEVEFYAHVVIKWGIKMGLWSKVGNDAFCGHIDALFRGSKDYGNQEIKISSNWYVWKINQPFQKVGKLEGNYRMADLGTVVSPPDIVDRMRTGQYNFVYPGY